MVGWRRSAKVVIDPSSLKQLIMKSAFEVLVKNGKVFYKNAATASSIGSILPKSAASSMNGFPISSSGNGEQAFFVPSKRWMSEFKETLLLNHKDCPSIQAMAAFQKEGYLNINDQRCSGVWGRVNDPADILGSCLLKDGQMVPDSFEEMPSHVVYSAQDGLATLTPFLHERLLERLQDIDAKEK